MKQFCLLSSILLPLGLHTGCNQSDPSTTAGDAGDGDASGSDASDSGTGDTGNVEGDYFPLVDGGTWSYRHTKADMTVWTEIVEMAAIDWDGNPAFLMSDQEDQQGLVTESVLVQDGSKALRVHKEVTSGGTLTQEVDYVPGFLRYDESWVEGDELMWMYERTEYDGLGVLVGVEARVQVFVVESTAESVTVPAGTFENCAQVLRTREDTGDQDRFWFAPGVGKVKRSDLVTGGVEELESYDLP